MPRLPTEHLKVYIILVNGYVSPCLPFSGLDPECPAYYGNRSACHMMLSQYQQALEDARASVSLDSAFVKGYIRIAKCCLTLGDAASAGQALDKASHIEPKNAAVMQVRVREMHSSRYRKLTRDSFSNFSWFIN